MEEDRLYQQAWQERFEEASITPPPAVWNAIESKLDKKEKAILVLRTQRYKWVAAASLIIACASVLFLYNSGQQEAAELSEAQIADQVPVQKSAKSAQSAQPKNLQTSDGSTKGLNQNDSDFTSEASEGTLADSQEPAFFDIEKQEEKSHLVFESGSSQTDGQERAEELIATLRSKAPNRSTNYQEDEDLTLFRVPVASIEKAQKVAKQTWAGISLLAGAFNPGFSQSGGGSDMLFSQSEGDLEIANEAFESPTRVTQPVVPDYSTGTSFSGGVNLGTRIKERFVISSGVHFASLNTGSGESQVFVNQTSNELVAVDDAQESRFNQSLNSGDQDLQNTTSSFSNEYQYLTVPLKAGVILLDKKFNITLNTGLASNFLVNANLRSDEFGQRIEDGGRYQSVYFNWLSSVEFGYKWQEHYQVSLEPIMNRALNDFTNTNHQSSGRPSQYGLSVGFRYNF